MNLCKQITLLLCSLLTIMFLVNPSQAMSDANLDIFYSNDVNGNTEPCG